MLALAGCATPGTPPSTAIAASAPAAEAAPAGTPAARVVETALPGPAFAGGPIRLSIHLPPGFDAGDARYPVLYVNDGQDMAGVGLAPTLQALRAEGAIRDLVVVAIHMPPDRMGAYGLSDRNVQRGRRQLIVRINCLRPLYFHLLAGVLALGGCATPGTPPSTAIAASAPAAEAAPAGTPAARVVDTSLPAPAFAGGPIRLSIHLPPGYDAGDARFPVLYVNDGQDMAGVGLAPTLQALRAEGAIRDLVVVAIHMPPDRMGAYGLSDRKAGRSIVAQTRYGSVGTHAHAYSEWVATTLVPHVDAHYRTRPSPEARAILGWSLGALNAFNLGWQYPELFGRVGAFSPSFWLSADRTDAQSVQRTRLAQRMVDAGPPRTGLKLFLAVGTDEERDDRDGDGLHDALDDTRDLILGWHPAGDGLRGLAQLGYSTNLDHATAPGRADVALHVQPGGRHDQPSWARVLPVFLRWAYATRAPPLAATGTTVGWQDVPSAHVPARNVDIWLPPGYDADPSLRYPVLYMHDGQNLFDPALSYGGVEWGIDEAMTTLIAQGRVRPAIVVGIWNTPRRFQEYMPRKPVHGTALASGVEGVPPLPVAGIASDAYLRFLVEELKPRIDATFRTRPGRDDTFVMGSSMGGLVSLYALAEYPRVFGGAAGVSTHWPVGDGIVVDWLARHLPGPGAHRLYFDHGTTTLDAAYAPYQRRMDAALRARGYVEGDDWITRVHEGAGHNEQAWRARVELPLVFLLGK